jgi:RNA polymerase sigma-70 factor (ECF subfamily)
MDEARSMSIIEAAYAEYGPSLRRRLTAFARDEATAQDLTQETFVRLLGEVRAGRVPENIGGWLWRVGQNLATSRGRRIVVADRHRRDLVHVTVVSSPESVALANEAHAEVLAALAVLDGAGRAAVTLAAQGLTGAEIARSIGRSPSATRTLLCRSRARVREAALAAHPG